MFEIPKTLNSRFMNYCKDFRCFEPVKIIKDDILRSFMMQYSIEMFNFSQEIFRVQRSSDVDMLYSKIMYLMCLSMLLFIKIKAFHPSVKFDKLKFSMPYETWQHSSSTINARKNDNILYAESAGLIDPHLRSSQGGKGARGLCKDERCAKHRECG